MLAAVVAAALLASAPAAADDEERVVVRVAAVPAEQRDVDAPTVDRLRDGDVLTLVVTDGVAEAPGIVRQCVLTPTGFSHCTNRFPVQFDVDGNATFQYQLDAGPCDGPTACVVVVGDRGAHRLATVTTVFGPAPPRPAVAVTPAPPYVPGQRVRVEISRLQPGAPVSAAFCASSCGPSAAAETDAAGAAAIEVEVGDRCQRCGIVVVSETGRTFAPVPFAAPASARYDSTRLVAGLAAAGAFLLLAWRMIAGVDWRPPSEAQTPELDIDIRD